MSSEGTADGDNGETSIMMKTEGYVHDEPHSFSLMTPTCNRLVVCTITLMSKPWGDIYLIKATPKI